MEKYLKQANYIKETSLRIMGVDPYNEGTNKSKGAEFHIKLIDGKITVTNCKLL